MNSFNSNYVRVHDQPDLSFNVVDIELNSISKNFNEEIPSPTRINRF